MQIKKTKPKNGMEMEKWKNHKFTFQLLGLNYFIFLFLITLHHNYNIVSR